MLPISKPIGRHRYCAFYGRRDGRAYKLSHEDVLRRYGQKMVMCDRVPDALASAMANQMYVCLFDEKDELDAYFQELGARP